MIEVQQNCGGGMASETISHILKQQSEIIIIIIGFITSI